MLRRQAFTILVLGLLVGAEVAVATGSNDGPAAVRYLFPFLWTLPLLLRGRAPEVAVLAPLGAIAVESYLAQDATTSLAVLAVVAIAFWIAGTIEPESRSIAVGLAAFLLGVVIVAKDPGPFDAGDAVFVAIVSAGPYAVGVATRTRDRRERDLARRVESDARAAVADERTRIARELHDVVGHSVTVMMVQAGAARMLVDGDPAGARERLLAVEESGREALAEMRRMLEVLRDEEEPGSLGPQPGVQDLDRLVADARAAGLDVELAVEGEPVALPPGEALAAYRIVQEALTNARKHAGGGRVAVRVRYAPGSIELTVEDDGRGPVADGWDAGGHRVIGMRERVGLYGGELDVGPQPGGGFAVRARLPIEARPA